MKPKGYVHSIGETIYDGEGKPLVLKGVNFGNWFVQEFWMATSCLPSFETGRYTQRRGFEAMLKNPNLRPEDIRVLEAVYIDNFIKEEDFKRVSGLHLNAIRINFSVYNLTDDGENVRKGGFDKLDWALDMAEKYSLYVILDLHGAIGSQNMDHHSGDDSQFNLYGNAENRRKTVHLWEQIAEHFKDRTIVCGYDLLNEPRRKKHRYGGKRCFDFYDELYKAVRKIDPNHMIFVECFSFPNHGADFQDYGWKNICYEYHIYNLTPISQMACLRFYKAMHRLMGYKAPVYVGEWNAWGEGQELGEDLCLLRSSWLVLYVLDLQDQPVSPGSWLSCRKGTLGHARDRCQASRPFHCQLRGNPGHISQGRKRECQDDPCL